MSWLQLLIDSTLEKASDYEETLLSLGALAVTLQDAADQPLYEPPLGATPLWEKTRVIALFEADAAIELITVALENQFPSWAGASSRAKTRTG